jgi:hypothetical protein
LSRNTQNTVNREFGNLLKVPDNFPKMVIAEDEFKGNSYEGVLHKPIRGFLIEDTVI